MQTHGVLAVLASGQEAGRIRRSSGSFTPGFDIQSANSAPASLITKAAAMEREADCFPVVALLRLDRQRGN